MTRIILHIGTNKSGSTAIQQFFVSNFTAAKGRGVLFPRTGRTKHGQHLLLADALGFQRDPRSVPAGSDELERLRAALDTEIAECQTPTAMISSEFFSRRRKVERVAEFLSGYDVRILVYLRRHDHWMASRYSQAMKTVNNPPWERGIKAFINFHRRRRGKGVAESYRELVAAWAEVFGQENIMVRPYEPIQNNPDLITDMLETIGAGRDLHALHTNKERPNRSLSAQSLALIEDIRRSNDSASGKQMRVKHVIATDHEISGSPRGAEMIPPKLRRQLVEENLDDYAYIARRYLGRQDGRLFLEPLPETADRG